jgi:Flp pilus assembly pilin Flp
MTAIEYALFIAIVPAAGIGMLIGHWLGRK